MKIYLESDVECTIDGVGLLEPGKPVEVNPDYFQLFHNVRPAEANFPRHIHVTFDVSNTDDVEEIAETTENPGEVD